MSDWLRFWEYTAAEWAGLQFLVLVAAAIFAWRQSGEARRLRLERSRPHVLIDLVVWETVAEFRITNIGTTVARKVRFAFDPPLVSSRDDEPTNVPLAATNLFKHGIPSMAPGKVIDGLFDQLPQRMKRGLPDDYEVTVSYTDALGERYSEPMTVGYSYLRDFGRVRRRNIHDIHTKIEDIAREVKRWTVLGRAIQVMTPADVKDYHRELDELRAQRAAEREVEDAVSSGDQIEQLGPDGRIAPVDPPPPETE